MLLYMMITEVITTRLRRYTHIEGECAFIDFDELLRRLEDLVCDVVERVMNGPFKDLLHDLNPVSSSGGGCR